MGTSLCIRLGGFGRGLDPQIYINATEQAELKVTPLGLLSSSLRGFALILHRVYTA